MHREAPAPRSGGDGHRWLPGRFPASSARCSDRPPRPCTAGRRHFGAIYVAEGRRVFGRGLADAGKLGRPRGTHLIRYLGRFAGAAFRAIEMDFREAGADIGRDEITRMAHRHVRRLAPPDLRPEMVAAKEHQLLGCTDICADRPHETDEIGRPHAGIPTELVDLVAGRFDEQRHTHFPRQQHGGRDDIRMRRADGGHGFAGARAIAGDQIAQFLHGRPASAA